MNGPKLYRELTDWWPLVSAPEDYVEEAAFYQRALMEGSKRSLTTLLELGSGGGNNASHLKARFKMTLLEPSPGVLEVSRRLNPECEHVQGDMCTVRLARQFGAVFVHGLGPGRDRWVRRGARCQNLSRARNRSVATGIILRPSLQSVGL